jgi:poly-gamma-glutamate synthesis protein (capsule biosynthesis protein)
MRKTKFNHIKNSKLLFITILVFLALFIPVVLSEKFMCLVSFEKVPRDVNIKLLFTGDIFLDRHIDEKSRKSPLKYAYPFSGLNTLDRENYDTWVGNLECPVTEKQSTAYEKENYLKFSCKKEYLPELRKYFDIVSLANNHTDNMGGRKGIEETRKHLTDVGIRHFGDFDNSQTGQVCAIQYVKEIPFAFCGFHGVYKLPTEKELEIIKEYSKYFVTFVMPHQGEEYKFTSNSFQKKIYRKMIDNGADVVYGSHPHVIQEVEDYKGKKIFYSLGNFIFDQSWAKTREHMVIDTEVIFPKYKDNYKNLNCKDINSLDCLKKAEMLKVIKPNFDIAFQKIYTNAGLDFVTMLKTK